MRPKRNMVLAVPTTTIGFFLAHSGLNVIFIALYQQNMRNLKLFSKLIPMVENSSCYSAEVSKCADKENYHSFFILPLSVFIWFAICLSLIVLTPAKSNQDEHHEEDDGKHLKEFLACWQGIKIEQLVSFCRKLHTGRNWYFGLCQVIRLKTYLGSIGAKTSNLSGQLDCEGHYERVMLCFFYGWGPTLRKKHVGGDCFYSCGLRTSGRSDTTSG